MSSLEDMERVVLDHFSSLYHPANYGLTDAVDIDLYESTLGCVTRRLASETISIPNKPFSEKEVRTTVIKTASCKTPGPDESLLNFSNNFCTL